MAKDDALQKPGPTSMEEAPDWIPSGPTGLDWVTRDDIKLPRLMIAQGLSPEVQECDGAQIEGLRPGMLFNDLYKEVYGKATLKFWIVRADPPHYVEFIPRDQGGGVKDPNVPANDPRALDGTATRFYDFVVFMQHPTTNRWEPI